MTFYEAVNLKNQKFRGYVDKSCVLGITNFVGDVPDEVVCALVNVVEMNVSQALFNFLVNSGGSINVVCEESVEHYASETAVPYYAEDGAVVGLTNIDFLSDEQGNVVINSAGIFVVTDSIQIIPVLFTNIFDWCQSYESSQPQGYPYGQQSGMPFNPAQMAGQNAIGYVQPQGYGNGQSVNMPRATTQQGSPARDSHKSNIVSDFFNDIKETIASRKKSLTQTLIDSWNKGYREGYDWGMKKFGGQALAAPQQPVKPADNENKSLSKGGMENL